MAWNITLTPVQSPALAGGQHTLSFTVVACDPVDHNYYLDFLIYQPDMSPTGGQSPALSAPLASTSTGSDAAVSTSAATHAAASSNDTLVYILAAVLSVVLLVAIIFVSYLMLGRRRLKQKLASRRGRAVLVDGTKRTLLPTHIS
jgi:hypothetical protein